MVLSTGLHPGALKDQVTSPGGTTIEAVATLEKTGFRNSLIQAMVAAADKSKKMTS
jgi:pyrroline-5-carboxylate reductase